MTKTIRTCAVLGLLGLMSSVAAGQQTIWEEGEPRLQLILPSLSGPMQDLIPQTLDDYFSGSFGWRIPSAERLKPSAVNLVVGDDLNNAILRELAERGLDLNTGNLGDEGFRILSHTADDQRMLIVIANTPIGLKHGCQELMYFRIRATSDRVSVDWPLDVRMKPEFAYRASYMLPCWSAHDSIESWRRVLKFHSELTLNRNWYWLNGFPLLEEYGGEYAGTDLADVQNVRDLIALCRAEGMKFYVGGGWFTWHHDAAAGGGTVRHASAAFQPTGAIERGIQYYLDMLELLPGVEGIYLEPPGEGYEAKEEIWRPRTEALQRLARTMWKERPEFEFALAIGRFNSPEYRQAVHQIDARRLYWWWCWGDPLRDSALAEHPLVLRWHTIGRRPNDYHGSNDPPRPEERILSGMVTSWDPGMGFGNPWNGWKKMGVDHPRNFHPYTMPLFSHQYWFRERSWNTSLTQQQFAERMSRRLFDIDMPPESIGHYLKLADFCPNPLAADQQAIEAITAFVSGHAGRGTPRNRDTLERMQEALDGIRGIKAKAAAN